MKKYIYVLAAAAFVFLAKTASFGANFYLSTEKSFLDSENARVKIESQATPQVTVRLYRVGNPEAFLRSRKNINRVYIESEYIRNNPAQLIFDYANIFKRSIREYGRDRVNNFDTRRNAQENSADFLNPAYVQKQIVVGKIKEYEFLREFSQKLGEDQAWTYSYIEFGKLKNGLYLTEVFSQNAIAYTLIHVSKIGLIIKQSETAVLAQTIDKKTGEGIKADIKILDFENGKELVSGKTAPNTGIYQYGFPKNKYSEMLAFARNGDDFTFYKVSFYPVPETERLVYIYTDSPIYKSGSTVRIKGIIRDYRNSQYVVPGEKKVKVTVIDPRGGSSEIDDRPVGDYGTFEASYDVNDQSPTGIYRVMVSAGGRDYLGEFRVENYVKPKFSVTAVPDKPVVVGSQTVKIKVKAAYFTGNRVSGGELKFSIFRTPVREDIFEGEKDIFEDPAYASKIEFLDSQTATLNAKGEYEIEFSPSRYNIDRDYAFVIKAQVEDQAQSRASGTARVKVVKAGFFVRTEIGKSVYTEGEDVTAVVRVSYPDGSAAENKTISYTAVLEDGGRMLSKGEITTDKRGYAQIKFRAEGKGFLKIALSAKDSYGNAVTDNVFTWIGQDGGTFVYTSGDITIVFDKEEYRVGDKARVLIVSPVPYAKALISRERETVFDYSVQAFKGNTMLLNVPIDKRYTPNFFFTATFVFNNQVYENTVKVKVPPADKMLKLAVATDKKNYSPRDKGNIRITVTDQEGKPVAAELSVSVVDEALYNITPEVFPDVRLFFYSYRWNSVTTLNSIALRFYGYSRELRQKYAMRYYKKKVWDFDDFLDRSGGEFTGMKESSDQSKEEEAERRVFKDQILWQGSLRTDMKGVAEIPVQFPDNLTKWRITAVAVTKDTRVGKTTATVKTVKEFFIRLNMPENMTYVDRAKAYVTVVNNTDKSQKVKLKVVSDKLKTELSTNTVTVPASSQKTVPFAVNPDKVGSYAVKVFAQGDKIADSMEQVVKVTPVSLKKVVSDVKLIQSPTNRLSFKIPSTAVKETLHASVGLCQMDSPFGVVMEALPYLKSYPYGCVEQTTSSFLPNLVAFQAARKLKMELPEVFNDKFVILDKGLKALYGFQNADGGWGWWNEGQSDIYMTAYVLYAMNIVKKTFPDKLSGDVYEKGVRALDNALRAREGEGNARIYGYYVLSECGTIYKDMVQRMAKNVPGDPYELSLLIMTAANSGLGNVAKDLASKLESMASMQDFYASWGKLPDENYWYGSDVIVTSVAVRALIAAGVRSPAVDKGIAFLLAKRKGNIWYSTRDTAEAVYTIADFAEGGYSKPNNQPVDVFIDNKKAATFTFQNNNYKNSFNIPADMLVPGSSHRISFNLKSGTYFGDLRLEYHDKEISVKSEDNGMSVSRTYYRVVDNSKTEPLEGNTVLKTGDVLLVEINADRKAGSALDYVVLEDGIPAGFLPVFQVNEYNLGIDFYKDTTHVEFGRGLASFFLREFRPGKFYYLIQATYPGVFYALPSLGYAMYRPEKRGNGDSMLFEVTE